MNEDDICEQCPRCGSIRTVFCQNTRAYARMMETDRYRRTTLECEKCGKTFLSKYKHYISN